MDVCSGWGSCWKVKFQEPKGLCPNSLLFWILVYLRAGKWFCTLLLTDTFQQDHSGALEFLETHTVRRGLTYFCSSAILFIFLLVPFACFLSNYFISHSKLDQVLTWFFPPVVSLQKSGNLTVMFYSHCTFLTSTLFHDNSPSRNSHKHLNN